MRWRALWLGVVLAAGCIESNPNRLNIGWSESPQAGMNPFLARNEGDYLFLGLVYEPLCMPMLDGSIEPWLAKSWDLDEAQKQWTLHLDERATWSDGEPLTAEDVKFTFEAAYENDFALGSTSKAFVESIEAVDAHTVRFQMKGDFAAFLPIAGGTLIMPEHIWSRVEDIALEQNPVPVGSGPFVVREFQPRAFLHAVRNESYWRKDVDIEEIVIRVFMNLEAEVAAFKAGELDLMPDLSGSESLIPPLEEDDNIEVLIDRAPHVLYLAANHRIAPWGDREFRQAIDLAVNKRAVLETSLAGYGEMPLMGYVPPVVTKWANTALTWRGAEMSDGERIETANALLDDLNFLRGKDSVRIGPEGEPLSFTISTITYPSYIRAAELIKESFAEIGIDARVSVSDPESLYGGIVFSGKRPLDWDLLVHGSMMNPDPDHFAREFAPEPPNPWDNAVAIGWENEEIQSLLRASRKEMDAARRLEMVMRVQELFAEELPVITLAHRTHPAAYRTDKFTGWTHHPVHYGGMVHPLGSIINLLSVEPKE